LIRYRVIRVSGGARVAGINAGATGLEMVITIGRVYEEGVRTRITKCIAIGIRCAAIYQIGCIAIKIIMCKRVAVVGVIDIMIDAKSVVNPGLPLLRKKAIKSG